MNEQAFELTSLAMRYWFAGLMLIAVLCALRLMAIDRRRDRRDREELPNGEAVGEFLVVRGAGNVERGERYRISRDIVIGRRRKCDVRLNDRSIYPRHARGELRSGGMLIGAIGNAPISLRGQPIQQEVMVHDGALVSIGAVTLQLTLYDVPVEVDADGTEHAIDVVSASGDDFDREFVPYEDERENAPGDACEEESEEGKGVKRFFKNPDYLEEKPLAPAPKRKQRIDVRQREFNPPNVESDNLPDYTPDIIDEYDDEPTSRNKSGKKSLWRSRRS